MRAVRRYTQCRWILLYVQRWLEAPMQREDGTLVPRTKGTPQGGVVSPLLANVFLHLAFDDWMRKTHPGIPFERYADDIVAHCKTEEQAQQVLESITRRLEHCRLAVHPEKTRIVYCKDGDRTGRHPNEGFEFLGYTFRPRRAKNRRGEFFGKFPPGGEQRRGAEDATGDAALAKSPCGATRPSTTWRACGMPSRGGWIAYFGRFYKSALYPTFRHFNELLTRWAMRKYKRLRRHRRRAEHWLGGVARREPRLFAHWHLLGVRPTAG